MGHGRKKDQTSHNRRNKSFSNNDKKPADDPFYELQVVDEHLVWITWEELSIVSFISIIFLIFYISWSFKDLEATLSSFSTFSEIRSRTRSRVAEFSEGGPSQTTNIPEESILQTHSSSGALDGFLQLVEQPAKQSVKEDGCSRQQPTPPSEPPATLFDDYTKSRPHLCLDGKSYGYETYAELEQVMVDINKYSHDRYVEWDVFYERAVDFDGTFEIAANYYDEQILVKLCPNSVLKRRNGKALYINAENVLIECVGCIMEITSGSHIIFGPYAQDVMVRGFHFKGASDTSLRFPHDGAEVCFEDCYFSNNASRAKHIGTVADVNSTSSIDFLRCLMEKEVDRKVTSSSLSIRTKEEDG